MHLKRNILSGTKTYLFAFLALLVIAIVTVSFNMGDSEAYELSRREIALRKIGHELLLQSNDSTSRVMPVKKIGENEYQVSFERELSFQPDSLVNIVRRSLANGASEYVVNVLDCANNSVTYGFAIAGNEKDDLIACLGRIQPGACYLVNIKFPPSKTNQTKNNVLMGSIALLGFLGFVFLRPVKKKNVVEENVSPVKDGFENNNAQTPTSENLHIEIKHPDIFTLGSVLFDFQNRKLISKETTIPLTVTESRVLRLLASSANETIERNRLQKEIWEDEGVIVGRSLDMFISKLRKKLEIEPAVEIVGLRGKGYRLEVGGYCMKL